MFGNGRIRIRLKRRKWRNDRKLCVKCRGHYAKYVVRNKKNWRLSKPKQDRAHEFCRRCFQSMVDSIRARELIQLETEEVPRNPSPALA